LHNLLIGSYLLESNRDVMSEEEQERKKKKKKKKTTDRFRDRES
jgi:hypothetical protein